MASVQKVVQLFYNMAGMLKKDQVNLACDILNNSGVIALPTDTLYGIAAKASDSKALDKIYKLKGRDPEKPLAVCVEKVEFIEEIADIGKTSKALIASLLPGPITIVFNRSQKLNKDLNPNVSTIGVRVPNHNFVRAICNEVGPLALTSANKSGYESPITVQDFEDIWNDLDCVFDAGPVRLDHIGNSAISQNLRAGSTVIDLTNQEKYYRIIREGCALNRTINTMTRYGYLRKR